MKYPDDFINKITCGDCFALMQDIPDGSVDLILSDLPYEVTACGWDLKVDLPRLWSHYTRIIKPNGAILLTATQPFAAEIIFSQKALFRYDIIWEKTTATGSMNARKMPLRAHESILVFYKKLPTYNPQMEVGQPYQRLNKHKYPKRKSSDIYGSINDDRNIVNEGLRFPRSVVRFPIEKFSNRFHPTQKPLPLFEYLVRTFSNPNDIVLDSCLGSGTTAVACLKTNRRWIGIELQKAYCVAAQKRLASATVELQMEKGVENAI